MSFKLTPEAPLEELAAWVCESLNQKGIESFLTGGSVVSIYTDNAYLSYDLDFVSLASRNKIKEVMLSLGFTQDQSRHFVHLQSPYIVEFPGAAMMVGDSLIQDFKELKTKAGVLKLLTPTDCVKDRLAAYFHWNDRQGLDQAVSVAKKHAVKLAEIEKWSVKEGMKEKLQDFTKRLGE